MQINWFTFVWSMFNFILLLIICAVPVVLFLWLVQTHRRLTRMETVIEELRRTLPPR